MLGRNQQDFSTSWAVGRRTNQQYSSVLSCIRKKGLSTLSLDESISWNMLEVVISPQKLCVVAFNSLVLLVILEQGHRGAMVRYLTTMGLDSTPDEHAFERADSHAAGSLCIRLQRGAVAYTGYVCSRRINGPDDHGLRCPERGCLNTDPLAWRPAPFSLARQETSPAIQLSREVTVARSRVIGPESRKWTA